MRDAAAVVAVRPRGNLALASRYELIEFLLTRSSGTADVFLDTGNTGLFANGIDVNGTTSSYWANTPYWTPAGDHNYSTTTQAVKDWFDLSLLRAAGEFNFLFAADVLFAADPATEEAFLDAGRNSTAGGWGIKMTTTGAFVLEYRETNGASLASFGSIDLTARAGQRHVLACYIDVCSSTPQVQTRAWYSGGPTDVQQADLPTPVPAVAAGQVVNLFGRGGGGGGNHLGQYNSITRLNRARFYHLPVADSETKWEEIGEEMWKYPAEHTLRATEA